VATTANIQIKVDGLAKLQKFREQLWESNKILKSIREDNLNTFNKLTGTIGELNRSLQIATENLQNVKRGTKAQKDEVVNYVTALGQSNKAQAEQNRLIQNEINLREQQAAALKRVKDNSITALPSRQSSTFVQEAVSRGRSARIARERSAFLLGEQAYPSPAGPLESRGGTPGFPIALPLPAGQQKALDIQRQKLDIIERTKRTTQELVGIQSGLTKLAQAEATARLEGARDASQLRGRLAGSPNQYDAPIGPSDVKRRQFQESVAGLRRIRGQGGRGLPPEPKGAGLKKGLTQFADFGLGAGFPLLFGGGAGQVAGGGIGTALGKSLGLASQAVFGLQIAFSAIGDQIEQAVRRVQEIGKAIQTLDLDRLAATTVRIDESLRSQVRSLIEAGKYAEAYEVAAAEVSRQTGISAQFTEDLAQLTTNTGNSWNEFTTAVSSTLSILASPFLAAMDAILQVSTFVLKNFNGFAESISNLLFLLPGVKQGLELLRKITFQTTEEQAKLLAQEEARTASMKSEAVVSKQLLDLEKERVTAAELVATETKAAGELKNVDLDLSKKRVKIEADVAKGVAEVNKRFKVLAGLRDEALTKAQQDRDTQIGLVEAAGQRRIAEAEIVAERARALIQLQEELRLVDEIIRKEAQYTQQATTAAQNSLQLAESEANVQKIQVQAELELAQAAGDVEGVYRNKVKLAEIEYDISLKRIRTAVEIKRLAFEEAKAKEKAYRQSIQNNAQNEAIVAKLRELLALQIADTDQKQIAYEFSKKLAVSQEQVAAETKKAAIQSAELARNTARAAEAANRLKNASQKTIKAVNNVNSGLKTTQSRTRSVSTNMTAITRELEKQFALQDAAAATGLSEEYFELAEQAKRFREEIKRVTWKDEFGDVVNKQMINDLQKGLELTIRKMNELKQEAMETNMEMQKLGNSAGRTAALVNQAANNNGAAKPPHYYAPAGIYTKPVYASGGYVSSPTDAVIGEGGSEYVIPASKMAAAMERYAAGKRGNEVVPNGNDTQVNVSTGPVMQMNGQNYVTQSDFEKGLRSTVNQVMTTLRRSPNTRAAVGI
jgi:hypothetical protein